MEVKRDRAFNEQLQEVQHQFLWYKKKSNKRFQKLEELIELAAQKLSILMNIEAKQQEEGFADSFGWKDTVRLDSIKQQPSVIPDSVCQPELRLPEFKEAQISECLQDCEHQLAAFGIGNRTQGWPNLAEEENAYASWEAYTGDPIYDEEPGEGQECWIEKEFILSTLGGGNINSLKPLQCEICRSEKSEEFEEFSNMKDFDRLPYVCEQVRTFIMSKDATKYLDHHQNQDVFCRNSPTVAETSGFGLDKKPSYLDTQTMTIFDPGGYVLDDQSKELHKLKRKGHVVQFIDSADLWGQDIQKPIGEIDKILSKMNQQNVVPMEAGLKVLPYRYQYMVLEQNRTEINKTTEGYEVSRIKVTIYIFDPGGDQYASC